MPTLELTGTNFTTIDFTGATYPAMLSTLRGFGDSPAFAIPFRSAEGQFRERSFQINIVGSSESTLRDNYEALLNAATIVKERWLHDRTNAILFRTQIGTTGANDIVWRAKSVSVSEPSTVLNTVFLNQSIVLYATVSVVTESIGRFASTSSSGATALENEQDGAAVNYFDLDLGDDESELALIDFQLFDYNGASGAGGGTAWSGSGKTWIWLRQGSGYDDTVFFQNSTASPSSITSPIDGVTTFTSGTTGGRTTNASGGTSAYADWVYGSGALTEKDGWTVLTYFPITISAANLPYGRFRVLVRVAWEELVSTTGYENDGSEIAFGLGYSFGNVTVTPVAGGATVGDDGDYVPIGVDVDTFTTIDIGEINIPPIDVPSGLTEPDLEIRVYIAVFGSSESWTASTDFRISLDYTYLADTRLAFGVFDGVETDEEIQVISDDVNVGAYKTDDSDVIINIPASIVNLPWVQSGDGPGRWSWARDDPADPSAIQANMTLTIRHRTKGSF